MVDKQGRSYEDLGEGQQLYRAIEVCTDPETLYAKIESGHWDWLGVQAPKKLSSPPTFLLGRPPRGGLTGSFSYVAVHGSGTDAPNGEHRVVMEAPAPHGQAPNESHWRTPEEARAEFTDKVKQLESASGSGLHRVVLYVDGEVEDRTFVVRALPNRL